MSIPRALRELAEADPDRAAITFEGNTTSRGELDRCTNQLARMLSERTPLRGRMVTIALPNSPDFLAACIAVWKLGAIPHLVSSRMPPAERDALIELADAPLVVGEPGPADRVTLTIDKAGYARYDDSPLPDAISPAWKALCSGGSTGRPKIILDGAPGIVDPNDRVAGLLPELTQIVAGPLYHNMAFMWAARGLFVGHHLVVMPRFAPQETLELIERHRGELVILAPTMMNRIWSLGSQSRERYDLSSLRFIVHTSSACPDWLKESFIDWLGPKRIWETYSGTERIAGTAIRGDEWLAHRGSVGRISQGRVKIVNPAGAELPAGEVGEIFMRSDEDRVTYSYIGAEARELDGWQSLGDLGSMDEDGYLYIADRRADLIIRGGANIYPQEVEAALDRHPAVRESVVVGRPDVDLGQTVHAIIRASEPVNEDDLRAFVATQLAKYKNPSSYEFTTDTLRDEAGKVRRAAFAQGRFSKERA
jgi:bile acid-coenzyme A ligase